VTPIGVKFYMMVHICSGCVFCPFGGGAFRGSPESEICPPPYGGYCVLLTRLLPAGLRIAQPYRYCFTQWSKNVFFAPKGRHVALINVKFGTGERTEDRSPCQISHLSGQKCGYTAPKTVKISNFGHKFAHQGSLICPIFTKFSDFVRVFRWILMF